MLTVDQILTFKMSLQSATLEWLFLKFLKDLIYVQSKRVINTRIYLFVADVQKKRYQKLSKISKHEKNSKIIRWLKFDEL